ncbi:hypothetical protein GCM10010116_42940 [Microbispora rosea subsp. aerata]|nr:DUF2231 domain-containing protein [Microbispora rosea]GGO21350.1 hypothetical protein GCM10010116_42940 [Microbispora rosea subsp. aerata]GIH57340.1 hypothetical protein Mro02_42540 [Microbispora rosea subsp. aerata]GLJ84204.1 hypothetical protein GCM10017588_29320 [Microbispora rosea subsp. aerata]
MFDQVFGLPAHALLVHAAVIFAPLLAVLSVAYAALPRLRHKLDLALVATAVLALGSVYAAKQSGEALERRLFQGRPSGPIEVHSGFGETLLQATVPLTVVALAMVWLTRARRAPEGTGSRVGVLVVSAAAVILAVVVGYYAVRTGHTGATAVWGR